MTDRVETLRAAIEAHEWWPDDAADGLALIAAEAIAEHEAQLTEKLAEEVKTLRQREANRERDAVFPEYIPENVTDAAYESQASWWRPGESPAVMPVHVAAMIDAVATATWRATWEELA